MARLSLSDFRGWFEEVVLPADDVVVVYSATWTFGHRFGLPSADLPSALLQVMLDSLGPNRTLVLPAYTPSYTRTRTYSPQESLPETGVLPQACLHQFGSLRTRSALDSFLAVGPQAEYFASLAVPTTLWGEGSVKSRFESIRARVVTLGIPWKNSLGTLHRIEELAKVPYRYYKTFHGKWVEDGIAQPWQETMFVRSIDVNPIYIWAKVDELLRSRGLIRKATGEVFFESADAADIVSAGLEIIAENPYALLENESEVRHWVQHRMKAEIDALRVREPAALDHHDRLLGTNL